MVGLSGYRVLRGLLSVMRDELTSGLQVPAPTFEHRQHLAGEGFVKFNQIHVVKPKSGSLEELSTVGTGPIPIIAG